MLNRLGYPVDMAANGLEALQALEHQSYNIILMDIQMPEMDGLEATRIIRQRLSAEKQPRIIALTAHALDYSREICIDAGMDNYISKPVQKDDLAEVLEKVAHELHIGGRSGHLTHLRLLICFTKHLIRSTRIVSISKLQGHIHQGD